MYKAAAVMYCEKPTDPSEKFAEKFASLFRKIKKEKIDRVRIEETAKRDEARLKKE